MKKKERRKGKANVILISLILFTVPYSVCDDEADAVTGTHANNNDCAVLSRDSDFYVFNVNQGYIYVAFIIIGIRMIDSSSDIPLDSVRIYADRLTFEHYKIESILKLFKFNASLLPSFAVCFSLLWLKINSYIVSVRQ